MLPESRLFPAGRVDWTLRHFKSRLVLRPAIWYGLPSDPEPHSQTTDRLRTGLLNRCAGRIDGTCTAPGGCDSLSNQEGARRGRADNDLGRQALDSSQRLG